MRKALGMMASICIQVVNRTNTIWGEKKKNKTELKQNRLLCVEFERTEYKL